MASVYGRRACEKEKYQMIGICILRRKEGSFWTKIPERVFRRSETEIYYIGLSGSFAKEHYMEELIIEREKWKKSLRIEHKVFF